MPELPEVETIKRILEPQLTGHKITSLKLNCPEIVVHPTPEIFTTAVMNTTIIGIKRRGKYLSILLDTGARMILHLRMTGCLLVTPPNHPEEKHTHLILLLDSGLELRFIDLRRFGRFWLFHNNEEDTISGIHKLGPEPFDKQLTAAYLAGVLAKGKRTVKSCLLDQKVIAGIGNIYADEILFAAKIRPDRAVNTLTAEEWNRLTNMIPAVLNNAIVANRMSPEEYLAGKGREYRNTPSFQVYGHAGGSCPLCGNILCRIKIAGRSSVYCSACQGPSSC